MIEPKKYKLDEVIHPENLMNIIRHVLNYESEPLDLSGLKHKEWEPMDKAFFGQMGEQTIVYTFERGDTALIWEAFEDLLLGSAVEINLIGFPKEYVMLLDCLYNILLNQRKDGVDPAHTSCGMLYIVHTDNNEIGEVTQVIGNTVMGSLYEKMSKLYLAGNSHAQPTVEFLEERCNFLFPIGNAFVYTPEDNENEKYFEMQTMCNYHLFYSGLSVWYRLEKLVQTFNPDFCLNIDPSFREEMDQFVKDVLGYAKKISHIGQHLVSDEGLKIWDDHIEFLSRLYKQ